MNVSDDVRGTFIIIIIIIIGHLMDQQCANNTEQSSVRKIKWNKTKM